MSNAPTDAFPPIVFVHGNGDTAALWLTTVWRFESNGWPRERLQAIDMPCPLARDDDAIAQPGRSSSDDARRCVADAVEQACRRHGVAQVVLIANSRGGFAVRNFIANGGAARVSHAILGGTPNHGVWADAGFRPGNEFNGAGPFLQRLNGSGADETTPGPRWMTVRSDGLDKYAQPDGLWIGAPGRPTGVDADGPALRGAHNVVIAGIDHRETSFGPAAFDAMWRFLAGRAPGTVQPVPADTAIELSGTISGLHPQAAVPDNLPLAGATVEVHATDPATGERVGAPLYRHTVGPSGAWGPLATDSRTPLEFVITAAGHDTTHIYRSPFARSSSLVHLRAMRLADVDADADPVAAPAPDREALSLVQLSRPRGYFGVPRDRILLDGHPPAGLPPGVPGLSLAAVKITDTAGRAVAGEFNGERIVGRAWPCAGGHIVLLELHS
jgi:hypothetical protein